MAPSSTLFNRHRVLIMGIVNCTPDSFSDGGLFADEAALWSSLQSKVAAGADVIDLGAESTRPGFVPVPAEEQITRFGNLVRRAASEKLVVSVDTTSPQVAEWALVEGARIINCVALDRA